MEFLISIGAGIVSGLLLDRLFFLMNLIFRFNPTGTYLQHAPDLVDDDGVARHFTLFMIKRDFRTGRYYLTGANYYNTGEKVCDLNSVVCEVDLGRQRIFYTYEAEFRGKNAIHTGSGDIRLERDGPRYRLGSGRFFSYDVDRGLVSYTVVPVKGRHAGEIPENAAEILAEMEVA
ncbi:MAG: hypothetical protein AAF568_02585 [Pseudomonadota bacterium]